MSPTLSFEAREHTRRLFLQQGFARVGFTSAEPVADHISEWVASGQHASMSYMAREPASRADPRSLLPGAQTVICVATAYPATKAKGLIAGYARGEDYHRTMREAMRRVLPELEEQVPGVRTCLCVDAAPLAERALAARAGLGWIGRNTMLLDTLHGPWTLLGVVITDAAFPPDSPSADRCGTCTACVEACPTEALDGDRHLDANRCLSYWTIEHRGEIPDRYARAAPPRVFGCDDCLAACPFPAHPAPALRRPSPFVGRPDLREVSLEDLERRADESFRKHFASTPIERARKEGLLRNLRNCRQVATMSAAASEGSSVPGAAPEESSA